MRTAGREREREKWGEGDPHKEKGGGGRKGQGKTYTYISKSNMHFKIKHTMLGTVITKSEGCVVSKPLNYNRETVKHK